MTAPDRPDTAFNRERIELVALALCSLDGREPTDISWGAAVCEAFRYVAAFDALSRHASISAAFVAAPAQEQ